MATKYDSYLLNSTDAITVGTTPIEGTDLELTANGEPDATLSGIVSYGATPTPVSYAKVTINDGSTDTTVYADINGYYSVAVDTAETYSIAVSKTGFAPYTASGITFAAATSEVLDVTLTALAGTGNMIYGTVMDTQTTAAAIANATVTVVNALDEVVQFTQTNADGEYAVYDLADATYTVIISKTLYAAESAEITVSAAAPIAVNNATLEDSPATGTGSISGTITDDATEPAAIANAWVGLYTVVSSVETLIEATLSGATGNYIFTGLDAGDYVVKSKKIADMT